MAIRKIIEISEGSCTGCGRCVSVCAEGAIELQAGKAKVVRDVFCDGFGACLGECPTGALKIIEREAEPFDEGAAKQNLERRKGEVNDRSVPEMAIVPGNDERMDSGPKGQKLRNWPIQLRLQSPHAPYFRDAHLLLAADCTAFAISPVNEDLFRDRVLIVGCPKLDDTNDYIKKLAEILKDNDIKDIFILHMEVPCCGQLKGLVRKALTGSGKDIPIVSMTVRRNGEITEDL